MEQTRKLEEVFSTAATDGWKYFIEEIEGIRDTLRNSSEDDCTTNDKWQYRRGQLALLNYVLRYKDICEHTYNQLNPGPGEDDE